MMGKLYRMRATAREKNDRATEVLVQARIHAAWSAPAIARLRAAARVRVAGSAWDELIRRGIVTVTADGRLVPTGDASAVAGHFGGQHRR